MRLKHLLTVGGLALALAMILGGIALGGWHFWRYVVAPQFGWVDQRQTWDEHVRVATSPFRRIEEKEAALDRLLAMRDFAATLTGGERRETIRRLQDVVFLEGAPLDLQFRAARVQQMLRGDTDAARPVSAPPARSGATTDATDVRNLRRELLAKLEQARHASHRELAAGSAERTRVLVTVMRRHPCDNELRAAVERLLERPDLPTVERSFLFAVRHTAEEKCS